MVGEFAFADYGFVLLSVLLTVVTPVDTGGLLSAVRSPLTDTVVYMSTILVPAPPLICSDASNASRLQWNRFAVSGRGKRDKISGARGRSEVRHGGGNEHH
jgi:hypothetical protein